MQRALMLASTLATFLLTGLTACGGGEHSTASNPPPSVRDPQLAYGLLIDSPAHQHGSSYPGHRHVEHAGRDCRSLTDPAVQQVYRDYMLAVARRLNPDYIGLAAETNLIRAVAPSLSTMQSCGPQTTLQRICARLVPVDR